MEVKLIQVYRAALSKLRNTNIRRNMWKEHIRRNGRETLNLSSLKLCCRRQKEFFSKKKYLFLPEPVKSSNLKLKFVNILEEYPRPST